MNCSLSFKIENYVYIVLSIFSFLIAEPIYEEIICDSLPNEEVNKLDSPDKIPDLKPVPRGRKLPSIPTSSTETPSFLELHNNRLKSCDFEDLQSNTVEENEPNFQKRPEEERIHSTNKIIVTGFKKTTSLDSMVYFFENKRKSGGDDVIGKKLNSHPDSLVLEFEDHSGNINILSQPTFLLKYAFDDASY